MTCRHEQRVTVGDPGRYVTQCVSCGVELERVEVPRPPVPTDEDPMARFRAVFADTLAPPDPAASAARFLVARIDAGKLGFGHRQRADRGRWR